MSGGTQVPQRSQQSSSQSINFKSEDEFRVAFRAKPLITGFSGKIECVTFYSSRVVIGTNDGRLIMYDTRKGTTCDECETSSYQFPHRKSVTQIIAVPHIRMVVVIADGELSGHGATDLQLLPFDFKAANVHKVKICCINQRGPPHFRLGVAALRKRAIVIYQYHNSDKTYKFLREFATPEVPISIAWYRNKVVIGLRKEYLLLNDRSGEPSTLHANANQQPQLYPVVKMMPKEEILISVMDNVGIYVGFNGEIIEKNSITWTQPPSTVEFTAPYLIGLIPRAGVEIHNVKDQSLVQSIAIEKASCIFGNGMKWDMEPRPPGDSEDVVIVGARDSGSNTSMVVRVEQMPIDQQVVELLDRGKVDQAQDLLKKSIIKLSSDKQRSKMKRFHRHAGIALLKRLEFEPAMEHLYRAGIDPCELIAFFPDYQCGNFAYEPTYLKPEVLPRGATLTPNMLSVIRELVDSNKQQLSSEIANLEPRELMKRSAKALLKFMEMYRKHAKEKFQARARSSGQPGSTSSSTSGGRDPRRSEAVDTALLRLYVSFGKQNELIQLLQDKEGEVCSLDMESCKSYLMQEKLYYESGLLLLAHQKYEQAINMFSQLHSGGYRQKNMPKSGIEAAVDALLMIPNEQSDLIFRESVWILQSSPKQALRIFTDRQAPLDTNDVLAHIKRHSTDTGIVQKYLETLLQGERDRAQPSMLGNNRVAAAGDAHNHFTRGGNDIEETPSSDIDPHHTRLALEYLDEVLKLVAAGEQPSKSSPGKEPGALGDARKRLLRFIRAGSSSYDVRALIPKVEKTALYNEFIILCGRGSLHEQAMRSLIYDLNDLKGAESYALKYGKKRQSSSSGAACAYNPALLVLVKLCLHAEEESKKTTLNDLAFQLLSRHGKLINGKAVLELIPSTTPVAKLGEYFSQVLPNTGHNVREKMLVKHMSNVYNLQVQCARVEKRAEFVEIDPQTTCCVCRKRIGDIVFAVYPNGRIVHYNCSSGKLDVCPVTGEKFANEATV
uniref:Uncharacterized protein AlNc14C1G199 n=1 Tax=Albugo laibachii Nc14 TaxID=890382 RepID=F0VZ58_9STRA|nr:conserved hypothetical protein [Albugo laibachii Nc14]|eukprot:CCA14073.1 conserved hypothetical protein [Albugo laibachii Nc14]